MTAGMILCGLLLTYSLWVFVVYACLGGEARGYRQFAKDRNRSIALCKRE